MRGLQEDRAWWLRNFRASADTIGWPPPRNPTTWAAEGRR